MEFIMVPIVVGICVAGTYGLFELFARKKERLALIEKLSDKLDANEIAEKLKFPSYFPSIPKFSFSALKAGCLLAGAGFGLMVGFFINVGMAASGLFPGHGEMSGWYRHELSGIAFGSSVLLFGGIGLIIAFVIELKQAKKA
jgi:hypothetical protein